MARQVPEGFGIWAYGSGFSADAIIAWSIVGTVDDMSLVRYCEILGRTNPMCLDEHGTIVAVEI